MPKITQVQTNFTGGECSPKLYGRVEIPRYASSVKTLKNMVVDHHGGVFKRHGSRFMAQTKLTGKKVRLIPYIFNSQQAYVLEFGDLYMRVYRNGSPVMAGASPYEIVTTIPESKLSQIKFDQSSDTMIICHETFLPQRLQRFADDYWILGTVPFLTQPYNENGDRLDAMITLSDMTVGTGRTLTASASIFLASDVGRAVTTGDGGRCTITAIVSPNVVTVTVNIPFTSLTYLTGAWVLNGSPMAACTPSNKDPVGKLITLTLDIAGWRTTDDNKYVSINGGLARITGYVSNLVVNAVVERAMTSIVEAPKFSWILNSSDWDVYAGYPRACAFVKQRLFFASSPTKPQTFWGSVTGGYYDFISGVLDTDAFSFDIAEDNNVIKHIAKLQEIIIMTSGSEYTLGGTPEKGLTATNPQVTFQSSFGVSEVPPIRIAGELYFVQRAGKKLRAIAFTDTFSAYSANDMSVLSDHIIAPGIIEIAHQQEPISILWCALADGKLASCTIEKEQDVVAWCRHDLSGSVESVVSVPSDTGNDVYISVLRGSFRYIEQLHVDHYNDSSVILTNGTEQTTWTGLTHLINKTVSVLADGSPIMYLTVNGSGVLELPRPAKIVMVGLPFTAKIETLTPEVATTSGSAQSSKMRIHEATIKLYQTAGCRINDNEIAFRSLDKLDKLDNSVMVFTGDYTIEMLGFETGKADIVIAQEQPLPMTVLSITKKVTFND